MARNILAVIVGYLTMFVFIFVTFTALYLTLGADGSFKPGTYDASTLWLVLSLILGTIAALLGGVVCRVIASTMNVVYVFAGIALVLGLVMAIPAFSSSEDSPARTAEVSNFEAMTEARTPAIALILNPLVAAVGIVAGGMIIDRRRAADGSFAAGA